MTAEKLLQLNHYLALYIILLPTALVDNDFIRSALLPALPGLLRSLAKPTTENRLLLPTTSVVSQNLLVS